MSELSALQTAEYCGWLVDLRPMTPPRFFRKQESVVEVPSSPYAANQETEHLVKKSPGMYVCNKENIFLHFSVTCVVCSLNVSLLSIIIPRYFMVLTCLRCLLFKYTSKSRLSFLFRRVNSITFDF
jgi:hypothetical protein